MCVSWHPRSDNGSHGLRNAGDDAFQLTVDYLKQEVVEPLRGLGRFLYMGIAGSFFLAFGLLLILLGVLRLLQTETGSALTGDWSWVPYAVTVVLGIAVIAVAALRIQAGPGQAKLPEVIARRERERSKDRRERADGRHDHEGRKQRTPHHAGRPASRLLTGDGRGRGHRARRGAPGLAVAGAVGILLLTLAFLAGRRRGRAKSAVVEIRRL